MTLLVIGGVIWLLLAGLPFGGEKRAAAPVPAVETIGEGTSTADSRTVQSATIMEVPNDEESQSFDVVTNEAAPNVGPPIVIEESQAPEERAPARVERAPAPRVAAPEQRTAQRTIPVPSEPVRTMPVRPAPARVEREPLPPASEPERGRGTAEISEGQAIGTLRDFLSRRDLYGVPANCIGVASRGYRNVGYTLEVVDTCDASRMLGRWRIDSKTREIFRQQRDGRFLRP